MPILNNKIGKIGKIKRKRSEISDHRKLKEKPWEARIDSFIRGNVWLLMVLMSLAGDSIGLETENTEGELLILTEVYTSTSKEVQYSLFLEYEKK